ncbi:6547d4a8-0f8a-493f-91f0-a23bd486038f [Sclerotinia trifoliorum]|uniref:6547d4a8-0f8a-493f-91f0-a23bd486038f n=1 Tax=Sclerotinia trifoliorum TaxID=28548 RepID=A0A8H2ZUM5_9HELO|nr:6547d4a8-0f8a-493f-91f0-a23bd486038f [Sclerotinia trifoliorum]
MSASLHSTPFSTFAVFDQLDKLEGIPEEPIETTETSDTPLSETKDEDPPLQEGDGSKEEENNDVPSLTEETQSTESDKPPSTTEESSDSKLIESSPNTEESLARDITEAELELASNNNIENPSDPTPNTNDNTAPSVPDPLPRDDIHDDIHDNIHDDGHALSRVNSHGLHSSHHVVHFADEIESTSSKSRSKSNKSGNDKKTAPPAREKFKTYSGKLSRTIGSSNSPSGDPDDSDPQSRGKKRKAKDGKEKSGSKKSKSRRKDASESALVPIPLASISIPSDPTTRSNDPITTCNEGVDSAQEPQETPGVVQPASDPEPAAISDDNPGEDVEKKESIPIQESVPTQPEVHPATEEKSTSDAPALDNAQVEGEDVPSTGEHSITGEVSAGDVSTVEDVQREVGEIANTKETPIVYQDVQIHEEIPVPNEAPEITDDKSTTADGLDVNTEDSSSEPVSEATVENPVTNEEVFPPDEHGPQESEVTEEIPSSEDASTITNESSVHSEESSDPVESISTNAIGEKDPSHIETPTISDEIEPKDDVPSSVEPAVVKESTNLSQEAPPLAEHVFEKGIVSEPESEAQLSEESIENSPSEEPNIQEGIINSTESASVPVEASVTIDNGLQAVDEREGSSGANQKTVGTSKDTTAEEQDTQGLKDEPSEDNEAEMPSPEKAGPENIDTLEVGEDQVDKEAILNESYSEANEDISKELESRDIDDDTETHGGPSEKVETGDVEDHVEDSHVEDDIVQDLAPTDDINEAPVVETNTGEDSSALENSNAKRESETIEPSDDIPNVPVPVLVEDSTQNQEKCAPEVDEQKSDLEVKELPADSGNVQGSPASEEPSDENQLENSPVIIEENSEPEISVSFEHTSPKTGEIKDNLKSEEGPITVDQPSIEVENPKKSQEFEEAPAEIEESQEIQANEGTTEQPKTEDLPSVGEDGPGLKNASPTEDAGNSHESPESDEIADLLMPEQDVMIEETHEQNEEEGSIEKDPELIKKAEKSLQEVAPLPEIDHNVTPVHTEDTFELLGEISQPEPAEEELSTDIPKSSIEDEEQQPENSHDDSPPSAEENPVESQADNTKPEPMEELPANSSTNEHGDGVEVEELNESDPAESENDGTSWDGDSSEDSDSGDEGDHENDETPVTDEIHSEPTSKEEDPSETEETKVPVLDSQLNEVPEAPVAENSLEFVTEKQNVQADEPVVVENPDFSFTQEETTEKLPESVDMIENIQSDETVTIQEPDISVPQGEPIETSEGPAVKDSSESVDEKKNTPPSEEKNIEEIHVPVPEQEQEQEQAVTENPAISAAESHPGPASEEDNPTEDSETEDHAAPVQAIEEEEPSQSEEIVTSEQVNLAAPVENSAENTDTAEVENSPAPVGEDAPIETPENVSSQTTDTPVPEHESKEVLKMPVEEEIEYESVIEDKNPIHSEEFVSDEDPDASVPKEQTVESVETPAAPEEVIQDEATEDVTALTDEEPETIDDDQSTVDDDEIAENAEATLAELESAPVDSILVQTVVVEEPLVETPPEEDISEKYAEPDSTPTETIPTEEPDTEDQVAEQPTADLTQDIPAETESESTPTDTTPAPVQEPVSLELPLEPEAAANDPIPEPEPVAVEVTALEATPPDSVGEPVNESKSEPESFENQAAMEADATSATSPPSTEPVIENLEEQEQATSESEPTQIDAAESAEEEGQSELAGEAQACLPVEEVSTTQEPSEEASLGETNDEPTGEIVQEPTIEESIVEVAEEPPKEECSAEIPAIEATPQLIVEESSDAVEELGKSVGVVAEPPSDEPDEPVESKAVGQEVIPESQTSTLFPDSVEEQGEPPKDENPAEVQAGDLAAAAFAGLAGAAGVKALNNNEETAPIAEQPSINESDRVENREDKEAESPSKSDRDRRRHRSSRHHSFSHHPTKSGDYPPSSRPEEQPRRRRHSHSHRTSGASSDREDDKEIHRSHRSSQKEEERDRPERSHRRRSSYREDDPERSYRRRSSRKEDKEEKGERSREISPAKQSPERRDSAIEGVDDERERRRRHRKDLSREEKEEHDRKKDDRRAAKREAAIKAEEAYRAGEARRLEEAKVNGALQKKKTESIPLPAALKRSGSRKESVSKSVSIVPPENDNNLKSRLLSLKRRVKSEVTSPFIANDEPQIKEKPTPITRSRRDSTVEEVGPPQFDITPERPKMSSGTRKSSSRSNPHHSHSSPRRESERTYSTRKEPSRRESTSEKYKTEEEKEARRARREMRRHEKLAKEEAEVENKVQREKDDELRRRHREERRRRREERENEEREANERDVEGKFGKLSDPDADNEESKPSSRPGNRERRPTRHHSNSYSSKGPRSEMPPFRGSRTAEAAGEKPKNPFKSFMTLGKKVFASEKR